MTTEAGAAGRTRFDLRASAADAALIRQAADVRGLSVTEFMLSASLTAARKVLAEDRTLTLTGEEFERLQAVLAKSSEPVDALVKLLGQPRRVKLSE